MRMPGIDAKPLPEHLETLRQAVAALSDDEGKLLRAALWADRIRANDARHQLAYERAMSGSATGDALTRDR